MGTQVPPDLLNYINELEIINEQLLNALKECLEIFAEISPIIPDKEGWLEILKGIQEIIEISERRYDQRKLH